MASKILMASSAGILFALGVIHLIYMFAGSGLLPRDLALRTTLSQTHLSITKETTVLRAWTGFNPGHSIALLFFGLIYGFLAFYHTDLHFCSRWVLPYWWVSACGASCIGSAFPLWAFSFPWPVTSPASLPHGPDFAEAGVARNVRGRNPWNDGASGAIGGPAPDS